MLKPPSCAPFQIFGESCYQLHQFEVAPAMVICPTIDSSTSAFSSRSSIIFSASYSGVLITNGTSLHQQ